MVWFVCTLGMAQWPKRRAEKRMIRIIDMCKGGGGAWFDSLDATGWVRQQTGRAGPARRVPLEMVGSSMIIPFEFYVRN